MFWLVFDTDGGRVVVLQPASTLVARLAGAVNEIVDGAFRRGFQLDKKAQALARNHWVMARIKSAMKGRAPITIGHVRLCLGTSFMALVALSDKLARPPPVLKTPGLEPG